MIALANQYPSSSLLLPLWKKGEDFGVASAFRKCGLYQSNGIGVDSKASPIKPVLDILGAGNPLKVLGSGIDLILVSVVDKWKSKRIWDKGLRYKSVNGEGLNLPLLGKLNLRVSALVRPIHANCWSGVSPLRTAINVPANTLHPTNVADFVQPFVASNRLPLFTRFADVLNDRLDMWKQVLSRSFNVELLRLVTFAWPAEVSDKVSIVARQFEKPVVQRSGNATANAVISKTRDSSNSVSIRNFILPFVAWDGKPILSLVFHLLSPLFPLLSNNKGKFRQNIAAGQVTYLTSRIKELSACQSR